MCINKFVILIVVKLFACCHVGEIFESYIYKEQLNIRNKFPHQFPPKDSVNDSVYVPVVVTCHPYAHTHTNHL